jgi:cytochrome oxidase assembly protein ShyY1
VLVSGEFLGPQVVIGPKVRDGQAGYFIVASFKTSDG